jgi:nucleolar protein 12
MSSKQQIIEQTKKSKKRVSNEEEPSEDLIQVQNANDGIKNHEQSSDTTKGKSSKKQKRSKEEQVSETKVESSTTTKPKDAEALKSADTAYVPGVISASIFTLAGEVKAAKKSKRGEDHKQSNDDLFSAKQISTIKATKREFEDVSKVAEKPGKRSERSHTDDLKDDENDSISGEDGESETSLTKNERDDRTVFVGNVPVTSFKNSSAQEGGNPTNALKKLEKEIRKEFSKYGKVESVRLRSIGLKSIKVPSGSDFHVVRKAAVAKASLDDRIETCNAFVVFADAHSVAAAVEKGDGSEFHGYHLRIDAVRESSKGKVFDRKCTIFIGNLAFEASEEECRKHCISLLGEAAVKSVRIVRDPTTNLGRGFGYVLLNNEGLVTDAVKKLNETKVRGRAIRVTKCERNANKKQEKNAAKFAAKPKTKATENFRGKMATDPSEAPVSKRRKQSTSAQKTAGQKKHKKA